MPNNIVLHSLGVIVNSVTSINETWKVVTNPAQKDFSALTRIKWCTGTAGLLDSNYLHGWYIIAIG